MPNFFLDIKNIIITALIVIIATLYIGIHLKDQKISELESSINLLSNEYVKSKQEEERNLQSYKTNTKAIQENTKSEIEYIKNFQRVKNETNCQSANRLLNSVKF